MDRPPYPLFLRWALMHHSTRGMTNSYAFLRAVRGRTTFVRHEVYKVYHDEEDEDY